MGLEDMLPDPDEDWITKVDRVMLQLHEKVAEYWQNKTYRSKDDLTQKVAATSTLVFGLGSTQGNYVSAICGMMLGREYLRIRKINKEGTDDIHRKEPKYAGKAFLVCAHLASTIICSTGSILIGQALSRGDYKTAIQVSLLSCMPVGMALASSVVYLQRVDMSGPPTRPEKTPFLERIMDVIAQPLPTPQEADTQEIPPHKIPQEQPQPPEYRL